MEKMHQPVLINEVVETFGYLKDREGPVFVDGTIGLGGHAVAITTQISNNKSQITCLPAGTANKSQIKNHKLSIIGIDKDKEALKIAEEKLGYAKIDHILINDAFENIKIILNELKVNQVDGVLLDLGVSSMQLDEASRGFSFQHEALLDMRMDQNQRLTAADIVNNYREEDLVKLFFGYGEEKFARRIASLIIKQRKIAPIRTTKQLADIILESIPKRLHFGKTHPATNVFRALRMEVNQEVSRLGQGVRDCVEVLKPGGRLVVISFHSIEDRIIKNTFRELADPCRCSKDLPECICGLKPSIKLVNKKPIIASTEEIKTNPRSRSAKLRIVERI